MSNQKTPGRPAFEPTEKQRMQVLIMCGAAGFSHQYIASQIINPESGKPIDTKTLRRYFRKELNEGMQHANAQVQQSLFKKAIGNGPQSVSAAIFWMKCRMGWKPIEGMEVTGKNGEPLGESLNPTERANLSAILKKLNDDI